MSRQLAKSVVVAVVLLVATTSAGIIRIDGNSKVAIQKANEQLVETTTAAAAALEVPATTLSSEAGGVDITLNVKDGQATVALSRDEDATVPIAVATIDPAPGTIEESEVVLLPQSAEQNAALSRDEDATIKLPTVAEPAAETFEDAVVLVEQAQPTADCKEVLVEKSAKLLLLSTPKQQERPKEQEEENIEEPEEIGEVTEMPTTTIATETETETVTATPSDEATTMPTEAAADEMHDESTERLVTKLYPVNIEDSHKSIATEEEQLQTQTQTHDSLVQVQSSSEVEDLADDAPATTIEAQVEAKNDNVATAVLIETEADYVLVDSDVEQFGTFTHADSDLHLQPIVQSVEIVPTYVDDPLLVNYVQHW